MLASRRKYRIKFRDMKDKFKDNILCGYNFYGENHPAILYQMNKWKPEVVRVQYIQVQSDLHLAKNEKIPSDSDVSDRKTNPTVGHTCYRYREEGHYHHSCPKPTMGLNLDLSTTKS